MQGDLKAVVDELHKVFTRREHTFAVLKDLSGGTRVPGYCWQASSPSLARNGFRDFTCRSEPTTSRLSSSPAASDTLTSRRDARACTAEIYRRAMS